MLEKKEKTAISNYDVLSQLFSDCCIKTENPYDMLGWIWLHMAIKAIRETTKIIEARGVILKNYRNELFVCKSVYEEGKQRNIKAPTFCNSYESMLSKKPFTKNAT